MKIEEPLKVCEHCGKPYRRFEVDFFNGKKKICGQEPDCNCQEEIRRRHEEEVAHQKELERLENARANAQAIFDNSLMSPFFRQKTFESLNETTELLRCKQYAQEFTPKTSQGIQMIGNVGTGKTTLLAAICNDLMSKGHTCLFTPLSTLLDKFTKYSFEHAGDVTPILLWLVSFDFVVLDDIARETLTDKRKEMIFRIIDSLLNYQVVTAFTANPEMLQKLKTVPELNACLDRLKEMCPIRFEFKGASLRGLQGR